MAQKQELRGKKPPRRRDGRRKRAWPEAARNSCRPGGETGNRKIFVCAKTPTLGCGETKALRIYIVRERRTFYELSPPKPTPQTHPELPRYTRKFGDPGWGSLASIASSILTGQDGTRTRGPRVWGYVSQKRAPGGSGQKRPKRKAAPAENEKAPGSGNCQGREGDFLRGVLALALRPGRAGEDRKADRGGRGPTGASARMFAWRCGREGPGRAERRTGEGAGLPGHLRGMFALALRPGRAGEG